MSKPAEFDRIRALLVRYAARLQDLNEEPPGQFLIAHALLQAVEMLDLLVKDYAPLVGVQREQLRDAFRKHIRLVPVGDSDGGDLLWRVKPASEEAFYDAVLALAHTGQPQAEVCVTLESHGQQSCYYGRFVSIEPYVADQRGVK